MQHDFMYSGVGGGSDRLLMFGSVGEAGAATRPKLKCPRCDSVNTKFCYYNNYNLSQPRHFCKACRRYWTKGGILRNVPVGGGSRSSPSGSKRSSSSATSKNQRRLLQQQGRPVGPAAAAATNALAPESSPKPSSPAYGLDGVTSSGGPAGVNFSPTHPAGVFAAETTVVVDGPSMDDLMTAADLFHYDLDACGDPFLQLPAPVDDVEELRPMELVDQTVPDAVVVAKGQQEVDPDEDVALRPTPGPAPAVTYNYVDNWHHVPLVSDNNLYYDWDLPAGLGVGLIGPDRIVQDLPQQQQLDALTGGGGGGGLLWDNTSYCCHQWGGAIEIDQSLLDLL